MNPEVAMSLFSACIITASDERQASVFKGLIAERITMGLYPREVDFRVYADPPGGRVGSGGGTLWALDRYMEELGAASIGARMALLSDRSLLMIHAGGQSRRLPAYVPEGKLFAPVPAASSSVLSPVILDFELALFLKYPWREGELLVASGDVIVDFSTELLDLPDGALCGFAAPETLEKGSRHGVFAFDPLSGRVRDFYQKASPAFLSSNARIDGTESCAVDLGLISFRGPALAGLFTLLESGYEKRPLRESLREGRVNFDLYVELLSAALGNLDREGYLERIAPRSSLSREAALGLFDTFQPCGLAGVLVKNSSFIHFGSLAEFPSSSRELREKGLRPFYALHHEELQPEVSSRLILNNSGRVEISGPGTNVYVENCDGLELACAGDNFLAGIRGLALGGEFPRGF
ncbi:MAG: L-fucokinase, partial [Spirochaetota bacterium]